MLVRASVVTTTWHVAGSIPGTGILWIVYSCTDKVIHFVGFGPPPLGVCSPATRAFFYRHHVGPESLSKVIYLPYNTEGSGGYSPTWGKQAKQPRQ